MTIQAAVTIACLYVLAYLLLLGYTCWLHKRVLRLEQFEWMRFPHRIKPESSTPCPGALCKAGRLPNGDLCRLCRLCQPERPPPNAGTAACDARWGREP